MICDMCGESTELENDDLTVWNADGDRGYHSYCAYPCSTCSELAVTENPNGAWSCADCEERMRLKEMSKKAAQAIRNKRDRFLKSIPAEDYPLWDLSEEKAQVLMELNKAIQAEEQA